MHYCNDSVKCVTLITIFFFLFFSDINECAGERDGCEHFCQNTIGSYYCMCRDGYYLHQDEKTCLGRQRFYLHQDKKPSLGSDSLFKPPSTFFSFYYYQRSITITAWKCPYSKLFWFVFSRICTEYGKIRMRENTDQNNSEHGHFLYSVYNLKIYANQLFELFI